MKNIFIIRHGQSEANANVTGLLSEEKEYVIDSKFSLTDIGKEQSYEAGEKIVKRVRQSEYNIYVSPFERTRLTARLIQSSLANKGMTLRKSIEDPRLVEQDFGDFDFQYRDEWKKISPHSFAINQAKYRDPLGRFFARLENGENLLDVYNRISIFVTTRLEREMRNSDVENHIIVTHGNTMRVLRMFLLDMKVERFKEMELPKNGTGYLIGFDEKTGNYYYCGEI